MALRRQLIRSFNIRGQSALIANIHKVSSSIRKELERTTNRARTDTVRLAKSVCPVRTGRMRKSITGEMYPSKLGFTVFYEPNDFIQEGLPYYPIFVELGTSRMPARPTLRWAYNIMGPIYRADVAEVLRQITRKPRP